MVNKMRGPGVMDSCYNWNRCQAIGITMERRQHVRLAISALDTDGENVTDGLKIDKQNYNWLMGSSSLELNNVPQGRWMEVHSQLGP